jgi:hypothetical protein
MFTFTANFFPGLSSPLRSEPGSSRSRLHRERRMPILRSHCSETVRTIACSSPPAASRRERKDSTSLRDSQKVVAHFPKAVGHKEFADEYLNCSQFLSFSMVPRNQNPFTKYLAGCVGRRYDPKTIAMYISWNRGTSGSAGLERLIARTKVATFIAASSTSYNDPVSHNLLLAVVRSMAYRKHQFHLLSLEESEFIFAQPDLCYNCNCGNISHKVVIQTPEGGEEELFDENVGDQV